MRSRRLVLASASPRRRELLEGLGIRFEIDVPDVDETESPGESGEEHVGRLAAAKASAVLARRVSDRDGILVLAADTTVELDGAILGKPADAEDALRTIERLAGRNHEVLTACRLVRGDDGRMAGRVVRSRVRFAPFDPALARWYAATGEPLDKAGGYALQGKGALLIQAIEGSWSNVVGLPLEALPELFREVGDDLARRLVEGGGTAC